MILWTIVIYDYLSSLPVFTSGILLSNNDPSAVEWEQPASVATAYKV